MTITLSIARPEAEIAEICRRYQIKELSVFGSTARGESQREFAEAKNIYAA